MCRTAPARNAPRHHAQKRQDRNQGGAGESRQIGQASAHAREHTRGGIEEWDTVGAG